MRTLAYALSLQKLGHEVQVVCVANGIKGTVAGMVMSMKYIRGIRVRRLHLNWMEAPDPNLYLYNNPIVKDYLSDFLASWQPQIMHITSCVSLSASVIEAAKQHHIPVVLTLTDFWFICPRVNLLKSDMSLCDGRTTALECLKCMMNDTQVFVLMSSLVPREISDRALITISKSPLVSRYRGMRGMAFDMENRKTYLSRMLHAADYVTAPSRILGDTINLCVESSVDQIVYSGHDLSWMESMKEKKRTDRLRISFIGQIIPLKGVHVLLSAFMAAGIASQAELVIYGDTSKQQQYVAELQGCISGSDASISFGGSFSHEQLGEVLTDVDLLVVPSLWHENNPRIIQEAFAAKYHKVLDPGVCPGHDPGFAGVTACVL